jgi:kynurenine aminotransferase
LETDPSSPANVPPDAINLGQGFMNWAPAEWLRKLSQESQNSDIMTHHYSHPRGRPRLIKAISEHYSSSFENLEGRKLTTEEIVVTAGANGGELGIAWASLAGM